MNLKKAGIKQTDKLGYQSIEIKQQRKSNSRSQNQ